MRKNTEEITKDETATVEAETTPVTVVAEVLPVTSAKTIQNGMIFYEVNAPVNGKAVVRKTDRLKGLNSTIKLIDLTDAEFADEALLQSKLIK